MLMRFDPFREFDSLARALASAPGGSRATPIAMDAYRDGDRVVVNLDLPGVDVAYADDALRRLAERPTVPHDAN